VVLTHPHTVVHMEMLKITEEMRATARRLLRDPALKFGGFDRDLLTAIADGKRKLLRGRQVAWWVRPFKVVDQKQAAKDGGSRAQSDGARARGCRSQA
jgi:hypothetical protein